MVTGKLTRRKQRRDRDTARRKEGERDTRRRERREMEDAKTTVAKKEERSIYSTYVVCIF